MHATEEMITKFNDFNTNYNQNKIKLRVDKPRRFPSLQCYYSSNIMHMALHENSSYSKFKPVKLLFISCLPYLT